MLMLAFTFVSFVILQFKNYGRSIREINSYVGWPLMGRHRAASSNYSLCSQAFAALHSLFVSFSFFIHFREPAPPFLPPVSRSGFVFSSTPAHSFVFSSFFFIFALNYLFLSVRDFLVWFALSLYSRSFLPFVWDLLFSIAMTTFSDDIHRYWARSYRGA